MSDYVLLPLAGQPAELVFGMRWHTILGHDLQVRARRKAREVRASHYAYSANSSEAVGTLRFARADAAKRGVVRYSAALVFASAQPRGLAALCVVLPDGGVWLVAVQAGKVLTQTDRVYPSLEQADAALDELIDRYGGVLVVHGQSHKASEPFELAMLVSELKPECALRAAGMSLASVPRPLVVMSVGVSVIFAARGAWDFHVSHRAAVRAPAAAVDERAVWQEALNRFAASTRIQPRAAFDDMLAALSGMPISMGGWGLRAARCEPLAGSGWSCTARYLRDTRQATNASFLSSQPPGWEPIWRPLDTVVARFQVRADMASLDLAALKPVAWHDGQTITALQQIVPAFVAISVGDPKPVHLDIPGAVPAVASAPPASVHVSERLVGLEGPLRSLGLIPIEMSGHMAWKSVEIRIDAAEDATLNHSRVMASATGVLYAKN